MFKKQHFFLILIATLFVCVSSAQARIDIVPQKVIIDSRDRSGEITILNLFNARGTFRIDLMNFRQNEEGIYTEIKSPLNPAFDPQKIVRFSPRQFSIAPSGRQIVRLSLRKPADLPEGEYRFHIKALRFAQEDERTKDQKNVSVMTNMGVTIPVIVRHGNVSSSASIEEPKITEGTYTKSGRPEINFRINREGNGSAIGKLAIVWQPNGGEARLIGRMSNANIFTEVNHRNIKLPLYEMPYGAGKLTIRYTDEIDKGKILDEITVQR